MPAIVKHLAIPALVLAALGGCARSGDGEQMTWARAALDRNEQVQVVAADSTAKTFTVRIKATGELRIIQLEQIVAGPAPIPGVDAPTTAAAAVVPGLEPAAPVEAPAAETASPAAPVAQTAASPQISSPSQARIAPGGTVLAAGDPARAGDAAGEETDTQAPRAQSAANARAGSVLASGPGYSIQASGARGAQSRTSQVAAVRNGPVERLHDPIICQGARMLHIDNRNLEFDGDALSAQDGCELHITNSHISAKGIGVLARAANVHIANSDIDGESGAIDASDGAQVYAESSRFKGLTRRLESSAFHDLGGNVWN
jgi:hypothetical protein